VQEPKQQAVQELHKQEAVQEPKQQAIQEIPKQEGFKQQARA
jgi:hypothetical protein